MSNYHPYLGPKIMAIKDISTINNEETDIKDSLLKFLLSFNVFESEFFKEPKYFESNDNDKIPVWKRCKEIQSFYNENRINNASSTNLLNQLKEVKRHFKSIYIDENGNRTFRFNSLQENKEENKKGYSEQNMEYIERFLKAKYENEHAIENALSLSYKFRNNLFHGEKDIRYLDTYKEDFNVIRRFLISLMKYLNENGAEQF